VNADRIYWLDHARGVGIVLVVVGHVTRSPAVHHFVSLFHMPLFFMLSGYLARPHGLRVQAWRRAVALLLPYAAFLLLVTVLDFAASWVDGVPAQMATGGLTGNAERLLLGGTALTRVYGVFWFVTCLYFTGQVFNLASAVPRISRWLLGAIALAGCAVSYRWPRGGLPLGLMNVPLAFFFYWIGSLAAGIRRMPVWAWPVCLLVLLPLSRLVPDFEMKYSVYGSFPINVAAATVGALLVVSLASFIPAKGWPGRILASLGRASLVIMFLHQLVNTRTNATGRIPEWAVVVLALLLPWLAYQAFERSALTRLLFLGRRMR
jgi:fucose 4-O-acetylase-like acetyltransferase